MIPNNCFDFVLVSMKNFEKYLIKKLNKISKIKNNKNTLSNVIENLNNK